MAIIDRVFFRPLRSGDWLTSDRARGYSILFVTLYALVCIGWPLLSDELTDRFGHPIGTDFLNVYAAGIQVWNGTGADAYDPALQHAVEMAVFNNSDVPFYGWHYPPFFLIVAASLALLPYGWALLAWMALSLPAYLLAMRSICPRSETMLVAAAFPAVLVNLGHGQNGFFTAALLGGALSLLDRKPIAAGILIGLLAYKPQFGLLIPLVLLVTGRWHVIASATVTVAALAAITTLLFGETVWHAFSGSADFSRKIVLEQGGTGWEKIQSLFSAVRMWGASIEFAYVVQGLLIISVAISLAWLWRRPVAYEIKAAALAVGCLLATPYILDYDLMVLAVAIAFMARLGLQTGFRPYEITLFAVVWVVPIVTRTVMLATTIPLRLLAMLVLYTFIVRRALTARQSASTNTGAARLA